MAVSRPGGGLALAGPGAVAVRDAADGAGTDRDGEARLRCAPRGELRAAGGLRPGRRCRHGRGGGTHGVSPLRSWAAGLSEIL